MSSNSLCPSTRLGLMIRPGLTLTSPWIEDIDPRYIASPLPTMGEAEAALSEYIAPQLPTMEEEDATLSDQSRDATPAYSDPSQNVRPVSSSITFPVRDPLKPSFPTVILRAKFLNFTTGERIDVDVIHKLRHTHLVYCEDLNSMPFLRGKGNIPFKHARVKTLVDNITQIFGDTAPKTVPTELDIHLYKYNKAKSFWAVKIGAEYVIVKGGGTLWRPWLGPEEEFHHLGVASAIGVDAGEAYESMKKEKKERKEARRAARAALEAEAKAGIDKATDEAKTTQENEAETRDNSETMKFDDAEGQDDPGKMKVGEAEGQDDSGTMEADGAQGQDHCGTVAVDGTRAQENSLTMASEGTWAVAGALGLKADGPEAKEATTPMVKKRGPKAARKSGEPAGLASLDLGLGMQELCEENTMTWTTFRVDSVHQGSFQHGTRTGGDVSENGREDVEAN